jgi:hypothetical protein
MKEALAGSRLHLDDFGVDQREIDLDEIRIAVARSTDFGDSISLQQSLHFHV